MSSELHPEVPSEAVVEFPSKSHSTYNPPKTPRIEKMSNPTSTTSQDAKALQEENAKLKAKVEALEKSKKADEADKPRELTPLEAAWDKVRKESAGVGCPTPREPTPEFVAAFNKRNGGK